MSVTFTSQQRSIKATYNEALNLWFHRNSKEKTIGEGHSQKTMLTHQLSASSSLAGVLDGYQNPILLPLCSCPPLIMRGKILTFKDIQRCFLYRDLVNLRTPRMLAHLGVCLRVALWYCCLNNMCGRIAKDVSKDKKECVYWKYIYCVMCCLCKVFFSSRVSFSHKIPKLPEQGKHLDPFTPHSGPASSYCFSDFNLVTSLNCGFICGAATPFLTCLCQWCWSARH